MRLSLPLKRIVSAIDGLLLDAWGQRLSQALFYVGAAVFLAHKVGGVLKHTDALTLVSVILMALGLVTFAGRGLRSRRSTRNAAVEAREPPAGEGEPTDLPAPLEQWIEGRLSAQRVLARQRGVRGDNWYFGQMRDWDATNAFDMAMRGVAPELADEYRADSRNPRHVDGVEPPHLVAQHDAYFERRLAWLRDTLRRLRDGEQSSPQQTGAYDKLVKRLADKNLEAEVAAKTAADRVLANRLADLYTKGEKLLPTGIVLAVERAQAATSQIRSKGDDAKRERSVRSWADAVRNALTDRKALLQRWDAAVELPPAHPTLSLIEPTSGFDVFDFHRKRMKCLRGIIGDLGGKS